MRERATLALALLLTSVPAGAQESVPACQSQQELEQVVASDGRITPDGCRSLAITVLESDGQRLCLLDLSSDDEGIVDQLREAALPERWWVRCDELSQAAAQ